MRKYRIVERDGQWFVQLIEGVAVNLDGQRLMTPEWLDVAGPFDSRDEAARQMVRLRNE